MNTEYKKPTAPKKINCIFSDFDGTLTSNNQVSNNFLNILSLLKNDNKQLIIVTGRSKSWGHFLLTHFNTTLVISEGGGVISTRNKTDILDRVQVSLEDLQRLKLIQKKLLKKFTYISLTADSFGRQTDRAIDLATLTSLQLSQIKSFLKQQNVNFSCSNIHLNFWIGQISKAKSIKVVLKNKRISKCNCLYFGDSLNDESAFKYLPNNSIGVSNIKKVINDITYYPTIILKGLDNSESSGVLNFLKLLKKNNYLNNISDLI